MRRGHRESSESDVRCRSAAVTVRALFGENAKPHASTHELCVLLAAGRVRDASVVLGVAAAKACVVCILTRSERCGQIQKGTPVVSE